MAGLLVHRLLVIFKVAPVPPIGAFILPLNLHFKCNTN
nr:MAG TPA: hypothetical protein [Caudoviricetes sp.]